MEYAVEKFSMGENGKFLGMKWKILKDISFNSIAVPEYRCN